MHFYWLPILLLAFLPGENDRSTPEHRESVVGKMKGVNFVAPRDPFAQDPMPDLISVGVDWVAVIPYGFTRRGEAQMIFSEEDGYQWWGEKPNGVRETIRLAKTCRLNTMLKPQVWIPRSWPGDLDFETDADWERWEEGYRKYILLYARMAEEWQVPLFCIGTEFKIAAVRREAFWRDLIREVRSVYSGKLTYAANWDEYPTLPFWDQLDYIGIDAYFPLSESETPSVEELLKSWRPVKRQIQRFSEKIDKPVIFTEYGYLSVSGCAGKTWVLEKNRDPLVVNEQAQANAIQALYQTFWDEPWWAGGFIWKWYPTEPRRPGRREKDYTPQGKMAQEIMQEWFRRR